MMYKKLAVAGLLFGLAVNANAVPVTFDLAGGPASHVEVTDVDCIYGVCGVTAELNSNLDSLSQTLSAGQSWSFDLFTFNFWGEGIGSGTVNVQLGFDQPVDAPAGVGSGDGLFFTSASFQVSGGFLVWNTQPGSFLLQDGTSYSIWFENLLGITDGTSANVGATVTLNDEPNVSVPEPGSLALLGLGLLGFGFATRRRYMNRA